MRHSSPISVLPLMTVKGSIVVSGPMVTVASMKVVLGSVIVTPPSRMWWSRIL